MGDLGFLLGIFLCFTTLGSVTFQGMAEAAQTLTPGSSTIPHAMGWICFLLFLGATQGLFLTITTALWAEVYGTQNLGAIRALASTIMIFAAAAAPGVVGAVLDAGVSFDAILITATLYAVASALLAARAPAEGHPNSELNRRVPSRLAG